MLPTFQMSGLWAGVTRPSVCQSYKVSTASNCTKHATAVENNSGPLSPTELDFSVWCSGPALGCAMRARRRVGESLFGHFSYSNTGVQEKSGGGCIHAHRCQLRVHYTCTRHPGTQ